MDMAVERLADAGIVKSVLAPRSRLIRVNFEQLREVRQGITPTEALSVLRVRQSNVEDSVTRHENDAQDLVVKAGYGMQAVALRRHVSIGELAERFVCRCPHLHVGKGPLVVSTCEQLMSQFWLDRQRVAVLAGVGEIQGRFRCPSTNDLDV